MLQTKLENRISTSSLVKAKSTLDKLTLALLHESEAMESLSVRAHIRMLKDILEHEVA